MKSYIENIIFYQMMRMMMMIIKSVYTKYKHFYEHE